MANGDSSINLMGIIVSLIEPLEKVIVRIRVNLGLDVWFSSQIVPRFGVRKWRRKNAYEVVPWTVIEAIIRLTEPEHSIIRPCATVADTREKPAVIVGQTDRVL